MRQKQALTMNPVTRILESRISEMIEPNKAMLIFGARRVGKTVLMKHIYDNFPGNKMFMNGEDLDTALLLQKRSVSNYKGVFGGIELLAIDEAQNIPEIGQIIKLIVDEIPGIRVIASGSS